MKLAKLEAERTRYNLFGFLFLTVCSFYHIVSDHVFPGILMVMIDDIDGS